MSHKKTIASLLVGAAIGAGVAVLVTTFVTREQQSIHHAQAETISTTEDTSSTERSGETEPPSERRFSRPLAGSCVLTGQVTDETGSPIANALVALRVLDEPWSSADAPRTDTTTQDGQFVLRDLPEDLPYQVWAHAAGKASDAADDVRCGQRTSIVLQPGGSLTVTVTAPEDHPVNRAMLRLAGTDLWPAREAEIPVGEPVNVIGLAEGDYVVWAAAEKLAGASDASVHVAPGQNRELRIDLAPAPINKIRVLDASSAEPIAGAAAVLSCASVDFIKRMALTDKKGETRLGALPENTLVATAFAPGYSPMEPLPISAGQEVELRLDRGASVSGVVKSADGQPLPGAVVSAETELGAGSALLPQGNGTAFQERIAQAAADGLPRMTWKTGALIAGPPHLPVPRLTGETVAESGAFLTDDAGRFRLSGLPSGKLLLRARHPDQVMLEPVAVSLSSGQSLTDLVLEMRPGCTAQVRVVDERGFPLRAAEVSAYDDRDTLLDRIAVAGDGYAQLTGLPPTFRLEATAEGRVPRVAEGAARLGGRVEFELSLPPADAELRGRVLDRLGVGIPDAEVTARAVTRGLAHVLVGRSAPDGTFSLPSAGSGAYHFTADAGTRGKTQVPSATSAEYVKLVIDTSMADAGAPVPGSEGREIVIEPTPLKEPTNLDDPLANVKRPSAMGGGATPGFTTSASEDLLPVTGPPTGRGSLPIGLGGSGAKVVISSVEPGSHAAAAGLAKGQKLRAIDGKPVRSIAQAKEALSGTVGSVVMLEVEDEDGPFNVVVQRVRVAGP